MNADATVRLDDLPSIAAHASGVPRLTLDEIAHEPTLDEALRDPALFDRHVRPFGELVDVPVTGAAEADAPLPLVALADFVAREDEAAREPLVGRPERSLLPRGGLVVVGGIGGSAKTTFTIDAVAHFASATTWHELELGRALRVAMIDVEGPREPLRQKLEHKLAVWEGEPFAENVLVLDGEPWGDFSFAQPGHRQQLRQACSELEIDLVVCNPLGRLGMPGGGTPEEVGTFVGWLRECGMWQDIAFWLIHHFNRGVSRDVLLRLSGALGIATPTRSSDWHAKASARRS